MCSTGSAVFGRVGRRNFWGRIPECECERTWTQPTGRGGVWDARTGGLLRNGTLGTVG